MPIPAATTSDVLLRALLEKQVDDFEAWISVEDVVASLPHRDQHLSDATEAIPSGVRRDIQYLENHDLLQFRPANPHVRLTPVGVYTALLFDLAGTR
jgi:hypothetical protein